MNPTVTAPSESRPHGTQHDVGQSVAELASLDLDAALQLLADRAEYITGAGGAAIALRRAQYQDMICRASVGSLAPGLGALLSTEHGLSGASIRSRQLQRCDDAKNDARLDSQACGRMGIASVLVMPILSEGKGIGVFELFSGRSHAFNEGDIAALQRLSAMVELAIRFSGPPQPLPQPDQAHTETRPSPRVHIHPSRPVARVQPDAIIATPEKHQPSPANPVSETPAQKTAQPTAENAAAESKKSLFWSASPNSRASTASDAIPSLAIPPTLRNLQKCQACGFPISPGRKLCVECEEKHWRGRK